MSFGTGENSSPVLSHCELPIWFVECASGNIGISDPNLDSVAAYNQAVKRALAFYAINQKMKVSSVYEYYYNNNNLKDNYTNQKSHWIAEFETSMKNFSYEVENVFRTKYNEIIVSIKVNEDKTSDNELFVEGSFMYHYDYIDGKIEYGEKQLLSILVNDNDFEKHFWESTIDNNTVVKKTYINELPFKLKHTVNVFNECGDVDNDMLFVENKYGLWDCYIDTFLQVISNFESENIVLKNSTRQITHETNGDFGDKSQDIIRRVIKSEISSSLKSISFKNSVFYANWEVVEYE